MNNLRENNPEEFLDLLVDDIRNEPVDSAMVEERSGRVWERIAKQASQSSRLSTCADFQALIPAYHDGTLTPGRRMLLDDHTHRCVECRKIAFGEPERAAKVVEMPVRRMTRGKWMSIAAAAAMVLLFGRYGYEQFAPAPGGTRATVQAADGSVYRVQNAALQTVKPGMALDEGEVLRTAAGSHAVVKLMDGSVVEVGERAEFRVSAARRDLTVHLNRGAVIVQAAKRRQGHLYVATGDTRVAVTGTVFSVNRGSKGTRVSVVEGEVIVEFNHSDKVLHSGDQLATHRSVAAVPIDEEVAWSRNAPEHLKMLKDMATVKESLEKVRMPGVRYTSPLLDQVPANTVVFLSVPNLRDSFEDAQRLMTTELRRAGASSNPKVNEFVDRMAKLTEYMGEEFVVAMVSSGRDQDVVGIADVHRPGLKDFLEKEAKGFGGDASLQIVEGDQPVPSVSPRGMTVVIRGQRVAFGSNAALIESALAGNTGFAATPFGQRISQAFREGTGILFGVDLQSIIRAEAHNKPERAMLTRAGADGVRYLIVEQETFNNTTQHSAVLNFDGARHGLASWLAAPGPMGGLSYVSSRAQFATSVITKDPRLMIDELIAMIEAGGANNRSELERMQQQAGVNFREDVAAALGSELTFAIDGPLLPTPSWKVIVEVNQPERLQQAIAKMVAAANAEIQRAGSTGREFKLEAETSSQGIPMHHLSSAGISAFHVYYTYRDGYLIAAATKELVATAIQNRDAGMRLDTSGVFRRLLPTDQNANFSAIVYQNAQESLKLLSKVVPEQEGARDLVEKIGPTLIAAYALEDRIQVTTYGSSMDLLMQTAFAPMLHGQYHNGAPKKDRTAKTLNAYR